MKVALSASKRSLPRARKPASVSAARVIRSVSDAASQYSSVTDSASITNSTVGVEANGAMLRRPRHASLIRLNAEDKIAAPRCAMARNESWADGAAAPGVRERDRREHRQTAG